MKAQAFIP